MKKIFSNKPIRTVGIFDSGLGGLTILNQLKDDFPNLNYIYFGDTTHLPYGNKSQNSIKNFSMDISNFLLSKGADLIIIACHSASAVALESLSANFSIPILGVIEPTITSAIKNTRTKNIGVLGTHTTIDSKTYSKKINQINNSITVHEISCPLFVPLVEEGLEDSVIAESTVKMYLKDINDTDIDTLILGCTHYPILINTIKNIINHNITIINSGLSISTTLSATQDFQNSDNTINNHLYKTEYFVSDVPYRFHELASKFLKYKVSNVKQVNVH